ncbi:MAG: hypothetical protein U9N37_08690, partial [Thermodesulfobacteriota bacterium]|nr:hypothetical protein [Thermodesulfobacteriota bacterium]
MKKITESAKKVKDNKNTIINNAKWIVGIDIGKKRLSCALMKKDQTVLCRFKIDASLEGFTQMLNRVEKKTQHKGKGVYAME